MILRVQNYNKKNKHSIPETWKFLPLAKFFSKTLADYRNDQFWHKKLRTFLGFVEKVE